jgi:hypothetical protein
VPGSEIFAVTADKGIRRWGPTFVTPERGPGMWSLMQEPGGAGGDDGEGRGEIETLVGGW